MNEQLLQFIWRFQYFNQQNLLTTHGDALKIVAPGTQNNEQGPDFLEAKIKLPGALLIGNVEIHVNASDWRKHGHTKDTHYDNVILHVVWLADEEINSNKPFPTLELQSLVPHFLLDRYKELMETHSFIPCENRLPVLTEISWSSWKERLAIERLQRKSAIVLDYLHQTDNHWEEVFWWMIARNFGIKTNAECFEQIARSISVNILAKHRNQIHALEALLLGQARLLDDISPEDKYALMLQREYNFLKRKYKLPERPQSPSFLRMRPSNFPTIRLAQLAMLIHQSVHLFSKLKETGSTKDAIQFLNIQANDYWNNHYLLGQTSKENVPKKPGIQMTENILINTVIPVLFAYGIYHNDQQYKDKALAWLLCLKPEKNNITDTWKQFEVISENALDSQALIELKNNYCDEKRCLECAVGNKLLRNA